MLLFAIVAVLAFLVTHAAASPAIVGATSAVSGPTPSRSRFEQLASDDDELDDDAASRGGAGGFDDIGAGGAGSGVGDPASGGGPELPADAAAPIPGSPAVSAAIAAGYAAAGLDHDPTHGWNTRARLAGLIPQISLVDGVDSSWHDIDPNIGRRLVFQVRATWRFDRLLFDQNELRVATIDASRRRDKRRIASRVIRAFFMWRRAMAAARADTRWSIRADEAEAELDALTDGWFSAELARRRSGLSAARTAR